MATKKAKAKPKAKPKAKKGTLGGTVHQSMRDAAKMVARVREGLQAAIAALPGPSKASGIKPLGNSCCTVKFSNLVQGSWAAETYVFPKQYAALADLVGKGAPETLVKRLLHVLHVGRVVVATPTMAPQHSIVLHPEVIDNVYKMLKGAPK